MRSRRLYDRELQASRQDVLVADDVTLGDSMIEDVGEVLHSSFVHADAGITSRSILRNWEKWVILC